MAKECPLVFIEWEDTAQPLAGWRHLNDTEIPGQIICVSVGWLIGETAMAKSIVPNMGFTKGGANAQGLGTMTIPNRCILRITKMVEPKLSARNEHYLASSTTSGQEKRTQPRKTARNEQAPQQERSRKSHSGKGEGRRARGAAPKA